MFKTIWRRFLADRVVASVEARLGLGARLAAGQQQTLAAAEAMLEPRLAAQQQALAAISLDTASAREDTASQRERLEQVESKMAIVVDSKPAKKNLHIPDIGIHPPITEAFMEYSTVSAADFYNPSFRALCAELGLSPMLHRKYWEWVFVLHHAKRLGVVGSGKRALGFAVGQEPLPSALAALGTRVVATDAPPELGESKGWRKTSEHSSSLAETHKPDLIDWGAYQRLATAQPCDMTNIDPTLTGFDLCWSCCSFEHLGDIEAGLRFVEESVERTLAVGGVAIHTTEFNLSSNDDTVESGATVLYRLRDMEAFVERMRSRGHHVEPLRVAPDAHVLDFFVDTPPYEAPVHLKLRLMGYTSTSVALIIRCGS